MTKLISKLLLFLSRRMTLSRLEEMIIRSIRERLASMSPENALRFLFRLDTELYGLEGPLAVAYDGGTHTKHRHTAYHDFFVKRVRPGARVLDVGCGIGAVAYDLASEAGAMVDGIDLNENSIQEAKRRYVHRNLHFAVQDALELKVEKEYDVVLLSNVLEHLTGRPSFLARLQKLTGAKRLLIRVPLFERDWRVPLKQELGIEWRLDPDHKTEYTLESFADEINTAGLEMYHLEVHWGEIWSEIRIR